MINMYQENKTIEEIVGNIEQQTPSRRYQIQMFLEDLLDIGTEDFINVGKRLLGSESIRFYIKHVFLKYLGKLKLLIVKLKNLYWNFTMMKNMGNILLIMLFSQTFNI